MIRCLMLAFNLCSSNPGAPIPGIVQPAVWPPGTYQQQAALYYGSPIYLYPATTGVVFAPAFGRR